MFAGLGEIADLGDDGSSVLQEDIAGLIEVFRFDGEEESAGSLCVGEENLGFFGDGGSERGEFFSETEVLAAASGDAALLDEIDDIRVDGGDGGGIKLRGDLGLAAHVAEVTEEAEAGDIGAGAGESGGGNGRAGDVE